MPDEQANDCDSISIEGTGCTSGSCALKAFELTLGDLPFVSEIQTEGGVIHPDRAAEVSRGQSSEDSLGNQEGAKARTVPARG